MIEPITDFASRFGAKIVLDENLIVKKENRFFFIGSSLRPFVKNDFFYAGVYLGKLKNDKFFPSFSLLDMISERGANKVIVNSKAEWLFICGRDILKQRITRVMHSKTRGDLTLVLNQFGECLGFGKIFHDSKRENSQAIVKNILDIGDYLRREKRQL